MLILGFEKWELFRSLNEFGTGALLTCFESNQEERIGICRGVELTHDSGIEKQIVLKRNI